MPERPEAPEPEIQSRLAEAARLIRRSGSLEPEAQQALAELVDELSKALPTAPLAAAEVAHLAESTAHLVEALHHQQDRGLLGRARARLEEALLNAEAQAPVAVGVARRLLDALANIGI